MLFDHAEIPRQHISGNNIKAPPTKRQRFKPMRAGKLVLATIKLDTDDDGRLFIRKSKFTTSVGLRVTIAAGQQKGRWFLDRFVLTGHEPSVERMKREARKMLDCHGIATSTLKPLNGLTVPIRIEQQPHWQTGKLENILVALSPRPGDETYEDFHELVSKLGEEVPGWQLYPDSKTYRLIMKRRDDLVPSQDGLSAVDRRRLLSCHQRFYERLSPAPAADLGEA